MGADTQRVFGKQTPSWVNRGHRNCWSWSHTPC